MQCCEIYHTLGKILKENNMSTGVGDEGGYAPSLKSDEDAIEYIIKAIEKTGYTTDEIKIALDAASSEWYSDGKYILPKRGDSLSSDELPICYLGRYVGERLGRLAEYYFKNRQQSSACRR